jgi:UDP-galactopyranose mutase
MSDNAILSDLAEMNVLPLLKEIDARVGDNTLDIICLSRLRWDFARQRPQHLMSWLARGRRVFYVEEPVFSETIPGIDIKQRECGVFVVTPHLREGPDDAEAPAMEQALLLDELFLEYEVCDYILWYYTPTAMAFTWRLDPLLVVYDCMNETSAFKSAPADAKQREAELLNLADVVFTNGYNAYEAMRHLHHNIHPFPVDEALAPGAWDDAWARMMNLINLTFKKRYSSDCGN